MMRFITKHTAVSRKVVQLKSIKAYATIPKMPFGIVDGLWLFTVALHCCQFHEFSARWKAVLRCYEYLFACVKRSKMDSELLTCLFKIY